MPMQRRQRPQYQSKRLFTAREVAEFEYCSLVWWYEQFDPLTQAPTEELFARMVELEQDHGPQAPGVPEYQVIEQLLLRRGAFDEGQLQKAGSEDELHEDEEERSTPAHIGSNTRSLLVIALVMLVLAFLLVGASYLLSGR
ncbi:MAG: hypothetical protein E6J34_13315 [Chloroflexi bacterium]|nr:MAG: hypothetical protein E6J34_13315 [Chloroflexota bacterium]